ncbi:MAG: hypothetical protein AB8B79_11160 [Granulosicoccus sp.]
MTNVLIWLHVISGSIAVIGMLGAWLSAKGKTNHRLFGKAYVFGMCAALILALIVATLTANIFLLLVGIFSAYFVYTGWRLAKARDGSRNAIDRNAALLMLIVSVLMMGYGIFMLIQSHDLALALIVFSVIAALPAWQDFKLNDQWPKGKERIVLHLNRMGGASIATTTAVFVVNVQTDPEFIAWLLPSVAVVPLMVYWTRRWRKPAPG